MTIKLWRGTVNLGQKATFNPVNTVFLDFFPTAVMRLRFLSF